MAPPPNGTYQIRNVGTDKYLTVTTLPEDYSLEVEQLKDASTPQQQWRLTNYAEYIALENVANSVYFAPEKDEADFPITPTKTWTRLACTDGTNGKIISFSDGNIHLVMMANQHNHRVQLASRHEADAKQQWEFQKNEAIL
ncbi:hypothetical protein B0H13DRAFT_1933682 [Mycena leptocephala]|nr:hypothetical protein B0H13DRAFT_1933682 [Mycena leptocephala]